MGREIRNVPKDWKHPKDEQGNYIPMLDQTYEEAYAAWLPGYLQWEDGTHEALQKDPSLSTETDYDTWVDREPYKEWYRPAYTAPADAYQIYCDDDGNEGVPDSPVFETMEDLKTWLCEKQGYGSLEADRFMALGYEVCAGIIRRFFRNERYTPPARTKAE